LLDWRTVRQNLTSELRDTHLSADGLSPPGNAWWYLSDVLPDAIGVVAILLILIGLWAVRRKAKAEIVVQISYALLFFVTISLHPLHWDRWLAPILPTLAILASLGLIYIVDWGVRWTAKPFVRPAILWLLVFLLLASPLYRSIILGVERTLPDTRLVAREWIHEHIPDGSKIATEWYSAPLDTDRYPIENRFTLTRKPIGDYCLEDFDYLVTSSAIYDRYLQEPKRYKSRLEKYDALWQNVSLVYEVAPISWQIVGPSISVFELKSCGTG
jgi:hypothetical protein